MIPLLGAVLLSSLVGSLHCAAMCGPIAQLAGGVEPTGPRLTPHLAYGVGRLAAYVVLGLVAGAIGAAVDVVGDLASVGRVAMMVAGATMLAWGAVTLLRALGVALPGPSAGSGRPVLYAIRRRRPALRGALIGLFTAALPCGWLYAFVVVAAGTGSPLAGALVMATFWAGNAPALLGAGVVLRELARRLGRRLPLVTAGLQIAVGVVALAARSPALDHLPASPGGGAVPTEATCHGP